MGKVLALALVLGLGACTWDASPNVATANQAVIVVNAYNAAVTTGTEYLRLPLCGVAPCRTAAMSQHVYSALKAGRPARDQILAALRANSAAPITALQTLQAAYAVVQAIPR